MGFESRVLAEERRPKFKKIIEDYKFVRVIEAHSGISGLIGETAFIDVAGKNKSFDALWISSLTDSVAKGYPDEEILSTDSRLDTVNQVLNVTTKPIMYDGDTGGFPEQLVYLVTQLERVGVSAVVLEDKKYPKSNSLLYTAKHNMESIENFVEKIKYAKKSQRSPDFMTFGRIESFIVDEPMEKALERSVAYLEAGADGIMIHSKSKSPKQVLDFSEKYNQLTFANGRKPLMCVPTTYCNVCEDELKNAGFNIVLYANHLFRASFAAMKKASETILKDGRAEGAECLCASLKDVLNSVGSMRTYLAEYIGRNNKNG